MVNRIGIIVGVVLPAVAAYVVATHQNLVSPIAQVDINGDSIADLVTIEPSIRTNVDHELIVYDGSTSQKSNNGRYEVGKTLFSQPVFFHPTGVGKVMFLVNPSADDKGYDLRIEETTPDFPVNIALADYKGILPRK